MTAKAHRAPGLRIIKSAMTPLTNEDGSPRQFGPYKPVLDACSACPARCCRLNVKVSIPDAVFFSGLLGLPFFAGLTLAPSGGNRSFRVDHDERVNPGEAETWPGCAEIVLRRQKDGSCGMLASIGGFDRCAAYDARPSTCRLYPITWTADAAKGGPAMVMCPVPYAVTPAMEDKFSEDATTSIARWELHDRIIAEWHEHDPSEGRTIRAFLDFAVPRAAEVVAVKPGPILAVGGPLEILQKAMIASGVIK